jgi:methionyl-tRNA formyltransferase
MCSKRKSVVLLADGAWGVRALQHLLQFADLRLVIERVQPTDNSMRVKANAVDVVIHCLQDINSAQSIKHIIDCNPDLILSVSYDQIFTNKFLKAVDVPVVNIHAGNPALYRGRAILCWQLMEGHRSVDLCAICVTRKIDDGKIISSRRIHLDANDDYGAVLQKVVAEVPELIDSILKELNSLSAQAKITEAIESNHVNGRQAVYYPKRQFGDEWLDWENSSISIRRKINALTEPNPGAASIFDGRMIRIFSARSCRGFPESAGIPGSVIGSKNGELLIKTGDTAIWISNIFENNGETFKPSSRVLSRRFGFEKLSEIHSLRSRVSMLEKRLSVIENKELEIHAG